MLLQVLSYEPIPVNSHNCRDEQGKLHKVDLFVNGDITDETHETIVGKTVSVSYLFPYEEIAVDVKILGKDSNALT